MGRPRTAKEYGMSFKVELADSLDYPVLSWCVAAREARNRKIESEVDALMKQTTVAPPSAKGE